MAATGHIPKSSLVITDGAEAERDEDNVGKHDCFGSATTITTSHAAYGGKGKKCSNYKRRMPPQSKTGEKNKKR